MLKCSQCGNELAEDDSFCKSCGKPVIERTPDPRELPELPAQSQPAGQQPAIHTYPPHAETPTEPRMGETCPPAEVHNPFPMYVGGGALLIAGLFFFIMAVEVGSDAWLLIAIAMLGLSIWLFVQAIKTPGVPSRR